MIFPVMLTPLGCKLVSTDSVLLPFAVVRVGVGIVSVVGVARTYQTVTGVPLEYWAER